MKSSLLLPAIVLMAAIMSSIPAVLAQQDSFDDMSEAGTQMHTYAAIGTISNVQFEVGEPAWILSGGW